MEGVKKAYVVLYYCREREPPFLDSFLAVYKESLAHNVRCSSLVVECIRTCYNSQEAGVATTGGLH